MARVVHYVSEKKESTMPVQLLEERKTKQVPRGLMKANVFRAPGKFGLEEKPVCKAGSGEAPSIRSTRG